MNSQLNKPRIIKSFDKLDKHIQDQIKLKYPNGFSEHLIKFRNSKGDLISALPFESEDAYYLVKMSVTEAKDLIINDDDYDDFGFLKKEVKDELTEKYFPDESPYYSPDDEEEPEE